MVLFTPRLSTLHTSAIYSSHLSVDCSHLLSAARRSAWRKRWAEASPAATRRLASLSDSSRVGSCCGRPKLARQTRPSMSLSEQRSDAADARRIVLTVARIACEAAASAHTAERARQMRLGQLAGEVAHEHDEHVSVAASGCRERSAHVAGALQEGLAWARREQKVVQASVVPDVAVRVGVLDVVRQRLAVVELHLARGVSRQRVPRVALCSVALVVGGEVYGPRGSAFEE